MREADVAEKFLEYISYDTQSDFGSSAVPSTKGQKELAGLLQKRLAGVGAEARLTDTGYVYGFLKGTVRSKSVGFIAHMDTSPDFSGKNPSPRIVKYKGGGIPLNDIMCLSPERFPSLNAHLGEDLIVTDGTTLLGADDKAGIAEIMAALENVIRSGEPHPDIYAAFTPDEEIGRGMDNFDLSLFKPDYAYTVDGGGLGELEYECFNAARAKIVITGESVHPGYAKGIMKNAALIAGELIGMLPKGETPAETEGREGFFHVVSVNAGVAAGEISLIIRDFDKEGFAGRKKRVERLVCELNERHGSRLTVALKDEYYNMGEIISENAKVAEAAEKAYREAGVEPRVVPIRGGTDGSRLTFMGIPCPNIFAGGYNFHGPYEYIPLKSMVKAAAVIENIIKIVRDS